MFLFVISSTPPVRAIGVRSQPVPDYIFIVPHIQDNASKKLRISTNFLILFRVGSDGEAGKTRVTQRFERLPVRESGHLDKIPCATGAMRRILGWAPAKPFIKRLRTRHSASFRDANHYNPYPGSTRNACRKIINCHSELVSCAASKLFFELHVNYR